MKKTLLLSILILLFVVQPNYAKIPGRGEVSGVVKSKDGRYLSNVNIRVLNSFGGTTTNHRGRYRLQLPAGTHIVQFKMIGYAVIQDTLHIEEGRMLTHDVILSVKPIEFQGVTVDASRSESNAFYNSFSIQQHHVKNVPSLGEPDIFKAMAILPGVVQNNDLTGNLHVRGGGADQNLILLDGVEIYNPYHLFGLLGTFNMQAIKGAEIFIGGYPVKYGDRLSSLMNLQTIDAPRKTMVNLGLLSSGFSLTKTWQKSFLFVAARRTYLDLLVPQLDYNFTDSNFKFRLGERDAYGVEVVGFYNKDHLIPEADDDDPLSANWGNWMTAAKLYWHTPRFKSYIQASFSRNFVDFTPAPFIDNRISDLTITTRSSILWNNHLIDFGISSKRILFDYEWLDSSGDIEEIFHEGLPDEFIYNDTPLLHSAYLLDTIRLNQRISLEVGLRYNRWQEANFWSPRVSAIFSVKPEFKAKINIGRYMQMLAYGREGIEASIGSLLLPVSAPLEASVISTGLDISLPANMHVSVEAYYKRIEQLPRFSSDFPDFETGRGNAYGADFFLKKDQGALTYQLAYSFSRSEAQFGQENYPFDWDVKHNLSALFGYEVYRGWFINGVVHYRSGAPITPMTGKFMRVSEIGDEQIPYFTVTEDFIPGARNSARLPDYFRFDLGLRKKISRHNFNYTINFQVLNLLNTENNLRYDWLSYYNSYTSGGDGDQQRGGLVRALPIIPAFGIEFEF